MNASAYPTPPRLKHCSPIPTLKLLYSACLMRRDCDDANFYAPCGRFLNSRSQALRFLRDGSIADLSSLRQVSALSSTLTRHARCCSCSPLPTPCHSASFPSYKCRQTTHELALRPSPPTLLSRKHHLWSCAASRSENSEWSPRRLMDQRRRMTGRRKRQCQRKERSSRRQVWRAW